MSGCVEKFKRAISVACMVVGLAATVEGATVSLAWNPNPEPDIAGYRLSYGTTSGQYTTSVDVGNTTSYTLTNLSSGLTYYFVLQAYNVAGTSPYSNEVSVTLASPLSVTNLAVNRSSPQPVGKAITFSATASGGTAPYQFKWWIIAGTTQTVGSNWSTNSGFVWTPTLANPNYTIRVWARNSSSTADAPDNPAATLEMNFAITSSVATNQPPTVNAGADQNITLPGNATLSATVTDDGLPSGNLTRSWTRVSGPGTVTFSAPTSATTTASFSAPGSYLLRLTVSDSALTASDDVAVTVAPGGTVIGGLVANWRLDEGAGTSAADSSGSYSGTLVNGPIWTAGKTGNAVRLDGVNDYIALPNIDVPGSAMTITAWVNSSSFPTSSDQRFISKAVGTAQQDHYWMLGQTPRGQQSRLRFRLKTNGATTTLVASAGDLPLNTWYHAAATYDGAYMRLYLNGVEVDSTAKSGAIATSAAVPASIGRNPDGSNFLHGVIDDVRIYNRALTSAEIAQIISGAGGSPNQAPIVNAGADQAVMMPGGATLNGTVADDGQPSPVALTLNWTKASGPGVVMFSSLSAATTTATFSVAGTYVLLLTASDGALSAADDVTVTVSAAPNQPPVVNAGANQSITLPGTATLSATVSDDGQPSPPGAVTLTWTRVSGTGTVTFSAPGATTTTATFSASGTYVLRLTAWDGALSAADDVTVTVADAANLAPTVNAGADRSITLPSGTTLTATVSDDGKPTPPGALTLTWTRVSGPATVTFSSPTAATTNASFTVAGTYVLRLTASDGALSATDDVTVVVNSVSTPAPGLVAHYRLDDGAGTIARDATGLYSGTLVNGATWVAGRHAGGVGLDGTDDYVVLPNINASGAGFTISTWVRSSAFPATVDQRFVSKATGTAEQAHDWMLGLTGNRLRFRLKANGVTTTLIASSGDLPLNTWYHATATYDGTRMRLYLNGVEVGFVAKTGTVAMSATVPLNLGRNPDGSNYMHGALDDVRIYNRALTPMEITSLMSNP
jgi:hypothetical protein